MRENLRFSKTNIKFLSLNNKKTQVNNFLVNNLNETNL